MIDIKQPDIGDIVTASEVNYKGHGKYVYQKCLDCDKTRWVLLRSEQPQSVRCPLCSSRRTRKFGKNHPRWNGTVSRIHFYSSVRLYPDDFFFPMADVRHYVLEHRLVMAKHLGRVLHPWEIVHHRNGIKNDNRIENLQLVQEMQHNQIIKFEQRINCLEKRITVLEAENAMLRIESVITREGSSNDSKY